MQSFDHGVFAPSPLLLRASLAETERALKAMLAIKVLALYIRLVRSSIIRAKGNDIFCHDLSCEIHVSTIHAVIIRHLIKDIALTGHIQFLAAVHEYLLAAGEEALGRR